MTGSPQTAFIATCDLSAHVRGRAAPISRMNEVLGTGVGWVPANLGITATGPLIDDDVFGSSGDLRLAPDPSTRCTVPGDDRTPSVELFLADQTEIDGTPWPCCPRTFLKGAIDDLARLGLRLNAAFEHEFMLRDLPEAQPFSWHRSRLAEPFGSRLVELLEATGLEPETWLPEYGRGQFEITLRPAAALVAADRAILLRELVRDLARRHGHRPTFAPLPDPDDVGNGVHVHFSLTDDHGAPVLYDPARPGRLSELGGAFAAGVLRHARAVCALTAASPVSYLRLVPHRWSAGGAYLAEQDREAMLRICPTPGSGSEAATASAFNLEFRAADATANPWLVVAAIIRAGMQGISAGYAQPIVVSDRSGRSPTDVVAMPKSLDEAVSELTADEVTRRWFDERLLTTYSRVKRADIAAFAGLSDAEQCSRVADVY
jgi:glutamine synthetase